MFKKKLVTVIACAALAAAAIMAGCSSSAPGGGTAPAGSNSTQAGLWAPSKTETVLGASMNQVATYTYEKGNLTSLDVSVEGLDGAATQSTFEYDDKGMPVAGSSMGAEVKYEAATDDKGQLAKLVATTEIGDGMAYVNTTDYTYDADGDIVKKEDSGEFTGMEDATKMSQVISYEDGLPVLVVYEQSGGEGQYGYEMSVSYTKVDNATFEAEVATVSNGETLGTSKVTLKLDANGNIEKVADPSGETIVTATYTQLKDPSAYAKAVYGNRLDAWVTLVAGLSS